MPLILGVLFEQSRQGVERLPERRAMVFRINIDAGTDADGSVAELQCVRRLSIDWPMRQPRCIRIAGRDEGRPIADHRSG